MSERLKQLLTGEHELLVDACALLLTHRAGFAITMFADLWVHGLEDGRFAVTYEPEPSDKEELFDDAREAVERFLVRRNELEMGLDFEGTAVAES